MKVLEELNELRHKLAGEAAHIKSLEGLLVDAVRERDEARAHTSTAAFMRIERQRDEARAEIKRLRDALRKLFIKPLRDAERERDEARRDLGEILAIIHRDGGHYTGEHGISKSVADAHATWAAMVAERDELKAKLEAELPAMWREDIASLNECLERVERERDEALAQVARREREHEALLETAQKALAHAEAERDEARAAIDRDIKVN